VNKKLFLLFGIFVALYVASNLLGIKIINFFGISTSVGIFIAPILFLITDAVEEVYGRDLVFNFIKISIVSLIIIFGFLFLFINLTPAERFDYNAEYVKIFGFSLRMIFASIVAFFVSQINDMFVFSYIKKLTNGKHLWLRNNVSTMLSQTIDTFLFMYLFLYRMTPKFDAYFVFKLALPYLFLKILFALFDTPFVYLLVRWLKK